MFRRTFRHLTPLAHLGAGLSVALTLFLSVLAASPGAHEWLHHDSDNHAANHEADTDEGCVITLFAQGHLDLAAAPIAVAVGVPFVLAILTGADHGPVVSPAFLLPPGCGPPAA